MNKVLRLGSTVLGVCAFLVFLGFGIESSKVAPDYALVFVDENQNLYIAPPCLSREKWMLYAHLTIGQAHKLNLNPEPKCREESGFIQEGRSLTGVMLEKFGLLEPMGSRWNSDGTWNW